MWETFLLQMNDFDRFLEIELQELLDPVVDRRPPTRRGRSDRAGVPPIVVETLVPEPVPVVEQVVVAFPVAQARSL
ncbi:MAG TPA: hypothetical protein VFL27_14700 [Candidatus Dormibacteraeota bacterium]|nr:hypothetical protein [Candidatus Dormibacteraeota bacterium]